MTTITPSWHVPSQEGATAGVSVVPTPPHVDETKEVLAGTLESCWLMHDPHTEMNFRCSGQSGATLSTHATSAREQRALVSSVSPESPCGPIPVHRRCPRASLSCWGHLIQEDLS